MKKLFAFLTVAVLLLSAMAVAASAAKYEYLTDISTDYYELEAKKVDEIYDGQAGLATTKWTVPFLNVTPTMDGKISQGEYVPFENFEDYLFYSMRISTANGKNSPEEFEAFLDATVDGFFNAYWGWDGQYLYLAFDMDCVDGYFCNPGEKYGGSSYLYACTAAQVGIGRPGCEGRDYCEMGFGINEDGNVGLTHTWIGNYRSNPEEDIAGVYDDGSKRLVMEFRINLQLALDMDETVQNGDQAKLCWLLNVGGDGDNTRVKQVAFTHGIGGTKSAKYGEYFATVTFDGMPDGTEVPIEEREEISELDKEYDLRDIANFAKDDVINAFYGNNATVEKVTEGDQTFLRITATGENAYVYSSLYPRSVNSDTKYVVIKYRTSSEKAGDLGIIYRSTSLKEYNLDELAGDEICADGEWHYLYLDMSLETHWIDWIVSLGIAPFAGAGDATGEYIDIAWLKCYHEDPWDIEEYANDRDAISNPTDEETTEEVTTEEATTEEEQTTKEEQTTQAPEQEKGCGSVVGAGALIAIVALGACVIAKKKD